MRHRVCEVSVPRHIGFSQQCMDQETRPYNRKLLFVQKLYIPANP